MRTHTHLRNRRWGSRLALGLGLGAGVFALAMALSPKLRAGDYPDGFLLEPRMTAFDNGSGTSANLDKQFTFSGWTDTPPSDSEIWIQVSADGNSFMGNGSFTVKEVLQGWTPTKTEVVGGVTRYHFSIGPIAPFRLAVNQASWATPWPDGGTGRVWAVVYKVSTGGPTVLPIRDSGGVTGSREEIVFADYQPDPTQLATPPSYLTFKPGGSQADTQNYYNTVFTDDVGTNTGRSITSTLGTLLAFKNRYFKSSTAGCLQTTDTTGSAPAFAKYFNKGDLGIGREMHCSFNSCTQETACYVKNYGNRNGTAKFTTIKDESKFALDANKPFATVCMVSRGKMAATAPNKVIFTVYGHTAKYSDPAFANNPLGAQDASPLALEAQLDNKGNNKFIPGNCLACHGGDGSYSKNTSGRAEVTGAYFLPFDLQHGFEYYSGTATNPLSRSAQEKNFKTLNLLVYNTDLPKRLPSNKTLIEGFYGGSTFPRTTFLNDFVPPTWTFSGDAAHDANIRQLYKKVVAKSCRTCHLSNTGSVDFADYDDFVNNQFSIRDYVCASKVMPHAEESMKIFWRSSARSHLVNRMNSDQGCGL